MGSGGGMEPAGLARRIEQLCRHLAEGGVDDLAERDVRAGPLVAAILAAVRGGAADPDEVGRELDRLDTMAVDSGVAALTTSRRVFRSLPRTEPGHLLAHVLLCPIGACSRRELEYSADPLAVECPVAGRQLHRVRLDP